MIKTALRPRAFPFAHSRLPERATAVIVGYLAIIILAALPLASCGSKEETSPQPPTSPTPVAPAPVLVRLELLAPDTIAPGESVRLTVNATASDGSVENVTAQAQWTSSNAGVLEISSTGIATAKARGEAFISARYQQRAASTRVLMLPAGTYRLGGRVTDMGFGIAGATVTVIGGVGEGQTAITTGDGSYVLFGASGHERLQAKGSGYLNRIEEIDVTAHRVFDFEMVAERERPDLRGSYTLVVGGGTCPGAFPSAASTRSYGATVTQNGGRITVALTDASFIVTRGRGDRFDGFIDANDRVTFTIGNGGYYFYGESDIVERFTDTTVLLVDGIVTAHFSPIGIAGTLTGSIRLAEGTAAPFTRIQSTCAAANHRFEMVRR
jgi:hypothetical protein